MIDAAAATPVRAEADRLSAHFAGAGARPFETAVLQPAGVLLDLYGEEIRARAYVTNDPLRGEMMLRPDFTVPLVRWHMESGADPARYAYQGEVFRRQEYDEGRPNEFLQVGYELFGSHDAAAADAEVFATLAAALDGLNLRCAMGDMGILIAAVGGLNTIESRKTALLRHIWRPRRFRALMDRFAGRTSVPHSRACLLAADDPFSGAGPDIGLRSRADVAARIAILRAEADAPPIASSELDLIDDLLGLRDTSDAALTHLRDLAVDMPAIGTAVDGLARRLDALDAAGIAPATLPFEAAHGRSTMEYYDGFVFSFHADTRPDLPPVATGGRYDALTRVLGQGRATPAVGGVIRPGLTLEIARC